MQTTPPNPENTPLDVGEFFRMLRRRKWFLLLPWLAALAVGVAAAVLLPPVYVSRGRLLLDRGQMLTGPMGQIGNSGTLDDQARIMREQAQTTPFLKSVITATGLKSDARTRAEARKVAARYPGLSEDEQVESYLIERLREAVMVKIGRTGPIDIIVSDSDARRAQKMCEGVSNQFVMNSRARQMEALRSQQEFSNERAEVYRKDLEEAEGRLRIAQQSAVASTVVGSAVTQLNYGLAQALLEQATTSAEDQRQRIAELRGMFAGRLRDNDPQLLSSPEVNALVAQLAQLENQLGRSILTESGPAGGGAGGGGSAVRLSIARKSGELENALQANALRALPSLSPDARDLAVRYRVAQADLQAKESWRGWIAGQIGSYQSQVVTAPTRAMDIASLQADVEAKRRAYNAFREQSDAIATNEAAQNAKLLGRFLVFEPANLPRSPEKPNRVLLVVLALVVGGVLGIGTVLVAEHQDQSMKNADEVEGVLGLPVLGAVPRVEELQRSSRRARQAPTSAAATTPPGGLPAAREHGLIHRLKVESPLGLEFKRIYLNLARARGRTLPRTLMLTSSTRGEGKTTTTAGLGITLAREHRQRTLLVDFDLRSPSLHRALGMPSSSWGLAQMLQQRHFDERFVRQTTLGNLDFLSAGKSERPAAELVDEEAVEWFLREAQSRYELVVIDTAPNLAVPDPLIIGRAVEGVIYVIKAGSTIRKAAEYGVRVQREARDNVVGVLMNDVGEFLPQYYGYKSNYYGYTTESTA